MGRGAMWPTRQRMALAVVVVVSTVLMVAGLQERSASSQDCVDYINGVMELVDCAPTETTTPPADPGGSEAACPDGYREIGGHCVDSEGNEPGDQPTPGSGPSTTSPSEEPDPEDFVTFSDDTFSRDDWDLIAERGGYDGLKDIPSDVLKDVGEGVTDATSFIIQSTRAPSFADLDPTQQDAANALIQAASLARLTTPGGDPVSPSITAAIPVIYELADQALATPPNERAATSLVRLNRLLVGMDLANSDAVAL